MKKLSEMTLEELCERRDKIEKWHYQHRDDHPRQEDAANAMSIIVRMISNKENHAGNKFMEDMVKLFS